MPRRRQLIPTYSHHKPSGQAYVRVTGSNGVRKVVYLGAYDSPESRRRYGEILSGLAVGAAPTQAGLPPDKNTITVNDVMLAFWRHAEQHYRRPDGTTTDELSQYRQTFRLVRARYGLLPAEAFGPRDLKQLRELMIEAGWCRKLINQRVGRVRRMFKWAASEQLIPVATHLALATVTGLQAGRTAARERPAVEPVAEEHVYASLPFLPPAVAAMVQVQLLTGMRPGEVCQLRPCDLDVSGAVWLFRPPQYKTLHRNKTRVVAIGPRAQAALIGLTPPDPAEYFFSPRRVVAELNAGRAARRITPRYPSHVARAEVRRDAALTRVPHERYSVTAYGRAVTRAVRRANARRELLAGPGNFAPVPHWHPNQLRHSHGTSVRHRFGLEAAQVALGHERADVTQVYAEKNLALAVTVAAEVG